MVATLVLRLRNRVYRRIAVDEAVDQDGDGVPDVFQRPSRPFADS
jgi:NhaA family Na+:H+ antiporter